MKLTSDQIKKVAKLANLPIAPEEEEKYAEQLSAILDYIEQLNKVDTEGIDPIYNVSGNTNITRKDDTSISITQQEALSNGSKTREGSFVTKGVFEE